MGGDSSFKKELLERYERFFGKNDLNLLIKVSKSIIEDKYIRINPSKITNNELEIFFKSNKIRYEKTFLPNCYKIIKSPFNLSSTLVNLNGEIYIQDIASQIPVNCIDIASYHGKKIRVLDMAASPGSKTTQLANLMEYNNLDFEIIALEPEKARLQKLINNLQRQRAKNVSVINSKGEDFLSQEKFDIVLLDAPCSGNLAGDKNWLEKRDLNGILERSKLQKKLLQSASNLLKKGGTLIYSTCSIELEENEENVDFATSKLGLEIIKPNISFPFSTKTLGEGFKGHRFLPHISKTQGFFLCCFKK